MFDVFFETMSMYLAKDDASSVSLNKNEILFSSFCELLAKNYREHKTMTWYAEQLHLTPKYFSSQIMRIIGKSASDWIQEWLLIRAKQLLDTRWDMNIQEISQSLGFEEQASFTRFFRRGAGMSPRQWRERDTAARAARG
jgi:AraC-like DNA-binding protein